MKKMVTAMVLGTITAMAMTGAASAATVTAYDSSLTVETPNDSWKEISDPDTVMTLTNGQEKVTVERFDKQAELPAPIVTAESFDEVYQTYYSTTDQVYLVTGYALTKDTVNDVRSLVESLQLADHPAKAEAKTVEKKTEQKTENKVKKTGESITLFKPNGEDFIIYEYTDGSWRSEDGTVYKKLEDGVWADKDGNKFKTDGTAVDAEKTGSELVLVNEIGEEVTVYEYTDGSWRSEDGNLFQDAGDGEFVDYYGNHYTVKTEEDGDVDEGEDGESEDGAEEGENEDEAPVEGDGTADEETESAEE